MGMTSKYAMTKKSAQQIATHLHKLPFKSETGWHYIAATGDRTWETRGPFRDGAVANRDRTHSINESYNLLLRGLAPAWMSLSFEW